MTKDQLSSQMNDKTQKILLLQEELINVRKELSKKQWQWEKEKSALLSKNQIYNIQIIQLKQRISNYIKINQALSNAITNQQQSNSIQINNSKNQKMAIGAEFDSSFINNSDSGGWKEKNNEQVKRLTKIIEEKDFQIKNLTKIGNQLRSKIEQRNSLVSNLQETVYNLKCKIQKKEEQILRVHKQVQQLQQKLQQSESYIDEIRRKQSITKKPQPIHQLQEPPLDRMTKYSSRNSPYLKMRPTPDHSACQIDNNSSYINQIETSEPECNSDDEDKLLCEICSRVFSFANFQEHAKYCGYKAKNNNTKHLHQRKREIEEELQKIRKQEQKQNIKNRYYQKQNYYEENQSKKQKISPIHQITKHQITKQINCKRYSNKNVCADFSSKNNAFYL